MNTVRRASYVFLCVVPFLSFVVGGVHAFRVPGVYQAVGVIYFAAIAIAAWTLGARAIRAGAQDRRGYAGPAGGANRSGAAAVPGVSSSEARP